MGRRRERNDIDIAAEHVATAITQYVMAQLYGHLEIPSADRGRAVVTGVQGELHDRLDVLVDSRSAPEWLGTAVGSEDARAG